MAIDFEKFPKAKIFTTHGVEFSGMRGKELYGSCPFSGKADKFYVNTTTWLWDSKTAGTSGNIGSFLKLIAKLYKEDLTKKRLARLALHRQLPMDAFKGWDLGWTGSRYSIPVYDPSGRVVDIRLYDLKTKQMRTTAGAQIGLYGAHRLATRPNAPVFLCEGEWDTIALEWLRRLLHEDAVVVGVPGAATFKNEWVPYLQDRIVHTLYDHDSAGELGEWTIRRKVGSAAKTLTYTHWPVDLPSGFDTRDWIVYGAVERKTPAPCWNKLQRLFKPEPRRVDPTQPRAVPAEHRTEKRLRVVRTAPTLEDVHKVFRKWLFLPSTDAIDVMLATVASRPLDGPPVWMFLVGPPGSAKTKILSSLKGLDQVYSTSSLTARTLASGQNVQGQMDPSLLPKLDGKVLVIKDFTAILGMRENDKEEIFSTFRDAFDGHYAKNFGNGVVRRYESRFTILAAVTPSIYDTNAHYAALGERFLKFTVADNLRHVNEEDIIARAIANADKESAMEDEFAEVVGEFLERRVAKFEPPLLDPTSEIHGGLIALSRFGSRLRGTVSRDRYNNDIMTGRPSAEVGSRLGEQLAKFSRAMAQVRGESVISDDVFRLTRKVMLDTVSQRQEDLIRTVIKLCPRGTFISTSDIITASGYPQATVLRLLTDMAMLHLVQKRTVGANTWKHTWSVSDFTADMVARAGLYRDSEERDHVRRGRIRLRRRPAR